ARCGAGPRDGGPLADVLGGVEVPADVDAHAAGPAPAYLADHPGGKALLPAGCKEVPVGPAQEEEPAAQRVALLAAGRRSARAGCDGGEGERVDALPELAVALRQQVA